MLGHRSSRAVYAYSVFAVCTATRRTTDMCRLMGRPRYFLVSSISTNKTTTTGCPVSSTPTSSCQFVCCHSDCFFIIAVLRYVVFTAVYRQNWRRLSTSTKLWIFSSSGKSSKVHLTLRWKAGECACVHHCFVFHTTLEHNLTFVLSPTHRVTFYFLAHHGLFLISFFFSTNCYY